MQSPLCNAGQRGFIGLGLGLALLAVFGTLSVGIEMAHRDGAQTTDVTAYSRPAGTDPAERPSTQ